MSDSKSQNLDYYSRERARLSLEGKLIQPKDPCFDYQSLAPKHEAKISRSFVSTATGKRFYDETGEADELILQGVVKEVF